MKRTALVTALLVAALVTTSTAAVAVNRWTSRTDGRGASSYWTQVDGPPAAKPATQPFGNVHVGWLDAFESQDGRADVYVYVDDFRCPTGVLPTHGGHEEDDGNGCTWIGSRFGEGIGLEFTADRKLSTARLRGQLTMSSHGPHSDGTVVGRPSVDVVWSGRGTIMRSVGTWRSSSGVSRYTDRYREQSREATMSGSIGPMGFDPALSGGSIRSFSSMYTEQSR